MMATAEMSIMIDQAEHQVYGKNTGSIKIGVIGEFFTMIERDTNFDILNRLHRLGASVHMSITLSEFVNHAVGLDFLDKRDEKREARKLLPAEIGGHGFNSIYNTIYYGRLGFDGVIHLLPLSCAPESMIQPLVDYVADKYGIGLYRFPIDENLSEVQFQTRLSTFISMLKRRKKHRY
jgi:predicted nucleotide-binding protein (sugar kinase/HSP70/actin superfamily)